MILIEIHKINFNKLNKAIKKIKPDIVIIVHLTGEVADNKEFTSLKKRYRFQVIEDASQAMFNKYTNGNIVEQNLKSVASL